jgi:PAS domain S-box-containing protein
VAPQYFDNTAGFFFNMVHPDDRDKVEKLCACSIQGELISSAIFRIVRSSGEIISINATVAPVFDEDNRLLRIIGVNRDITESVLSQAAIEGHV